MAKSAATLTSVPPRVLKFHEEPGPVGGGSLGDGQPKRRSRVGYRGNLRDEYVAAGGKGIVSSQTLHPLARRQIFSATRRSLRRELWPLRAELVHCLAELEADGGA